MNKMGLIIVAAIVIALAATFYALNSGGKNDAAKLLYPDGIQATKVTTNTSDAPLTRIVPPPAGKKSFAPPTQDDVDTAQKAGTRKAIIVTSKGVIKADLFGADMPLTVASFVKLSQAKFYSGLTFHRVEPGFVIQGGDPAGSGSGGPGYEIRMETSPKHKHVTGALAMARSQDVNSAGSQFYITLDDNEATRKLDDPSSPYAVFGQVTEGMEVAKKIAIGDKIISITIQ